MPPLDGCPPPERIRPRLGPPKLVLQPGANPSLISEKMQVVLTFLKETAPSAKRTWHAAPNQLVVTVIGTLEFETSQVRSSRSALATFFSPKTRRARGRAGESLDRTRGVESTLCFKKMLLFYSGPISSGSPRHLQLEPIASLGPKITPHR